MFVNRGYDVLQDHVAGRNIFTFDYRTNGANVARNSANPFPAIAADGWKTFLTEEIFPLSFTQSTARWTPNYSLHLIGGLSRLKYQAAGADGVKADGMLYEHVTPGDAPARPSAT